MSDQDAIAVNTAPLSAPFKPAIRKAFVETATKASPKVALKRTPTGKVRGNHGAKAVVMKPGDPSLVPGYETAGTTTGAPVKTDYSRFFQDLQSGAMDLVSRAARIGAGASSRGVSKDSIKAIKQTIRGLNAIGERLEFQWNAEHVIPRAKKATKVARGA